MEWADKKVWKSVLENQQLQNNLRIQKLFYHIHAVQYAFLRIWKNEKVKTENKEDFKDILALKKWGDEYYNELNSYFNEYREIDTDKIITVPWAILIQRQTGRKAESINLGESIIHVSIHSAYHRGQINTAIREAGGNPALVDFIAWGWYGKPLPDQP